MNMGTFSDAVSAKVCTTMYVHALMLSWPSRADREEAQVVDGVLVLTEVVFSMVVEDSLLNIFDMRITKTITLTVCVIQVNLLMFLYF